jgi:hypothetical protein
MVTGHPVGAESRSITMSEGTVPPGWINGQLFIENQIRFPREEYLKHAGEYVAWSLDGSRMLASAKTNDELEEKVRAMGLKMGEWVGDYIDPPEITGWL